MFCFLKPHWWQIQNCLIFNQHFHLRKAEAKKKKKKGRALKNLLVSALKSTSHGAGALETVCKQFSNQNLTCSVMLKTPCCLSRNTDAKVSNTQMEEMHSLMAFYTSKGSWQVVNLKGTSKGTFPMMQYQHDLITWRATQKRPWHANSLLGKSWNCLHKWFHNALLLIKV